MYNCAGLQVRIHRDVVVLVRCRPAALRTSDVSSLEAKDRWALGNDDDATGPGNELLFADGERRCSLEHEEEVDRLGVCGWMRAPDKPEICARPKPEPRSARYEGVRSSGRCWAPRLSYCFVSRHQHLRYAPVLWQQSAPGGIPDERSLARKSAARATSSSVAIRPSAVPAAASESAGSMVRPPSFARRSSRLAQCVREDRVRARAR